MTLFDVYDTPETSGIFSGFVNLDVPWTGERIATNLNMLYYYMHSGQKTVSPLVTSHLDSNSKIDDTANTRLAELIYNVCSESWKRDYLALVTSEYSPIENVDGYLSETTTTAGDKSGSSSMADSGTDTHAKAGNDTLARTGTDTSRHSGTDTMTETGTDTVAHSGTDTDTATSNVTTQTHEYKLSQEVPTGTSTTENSVYGFNSDTDANDSKSVTTLDQKTRTITRTLSIQTDSDGNPVLDDDGNEIEKPGKNQVKTDTESTDSHEHGETVTDTKALSTETAHDTADTRTLDLSDKTVYNSSDTETLNISHNGTTTESTNGTIQHELHRHGNIGITTNQHMINEEIDLRKTKFFNIVFDDIDKFLTLSVY